MEPRRRGGDGDPSRTSGSCSRWARTTGWSNAIGYPHLDRPALLDGHVVLRRGYRRVGLCRLLGISRTGRVAAALAYMLTPFVIDYIARISAIVMPWAALGWMDGVDHPRGAQGRVALPRPLRFLVIALVGGVNATSILLVGLAPLMWVLFAVFVYQGVDRSGRRGEGRAAHRAPLARGPRCGGWRGCGPKARTASIFLKYTETLPTVSITSLASEVLRGLGYWYFYGQDKLRAVDLGIPRGTRSGRGSSA